MDRRSILVHAVWDPEADVFVATSEDVPGLATEAATPAELLKKLQVMIPELLELNGDPRVNDRDFSEVPLAVIYEQFAKVRLCA
ncbi:MAG TPA: DUF1902 domain-containing protein [Aliidongia sp.]|nr:DUF1902 domain-containing protein [Aliidongia sp.]